MAGYTKLHSDMLESSIWSEDDKTRIVWITMLLLTDAKGYVGASLPGLAHAARVDLASCEHAVKRLSSPDQYSRTKENDGRRIAEVDGGWVIINYEKHRNRVSSDAEAAGARDRMRRYRARKKESTRNVTDGYGELRDTASASGDASSSERGGVGGWTPKTMPEDGWPWEVVQAQSALPTVAVSEQVARGYFDKRTACGWVDAAGREVARTRAALQSDLRTWAVQSPSHGKRGNTGGKSESPYQLQLRIDAVKAELAKLPSYAADRTPEQKARAAKLTATIKSYRKQIAGLGE